MAIGLAVAGCDNAEPPRAAPTSAASTPTAASSVVPTGTWAGHRQGPLTRIPPGLSLPDEGEPDWDTDNARDTAWRFDPCLPTTYPTDRRRTDFRTVHTDGPEYYFDRQLGVYPDAATAREVMDGFRRVIDACRTGTRNGTPWWWRSTPLPDTGHEALLAYGLHGQPGQVGVTQTLAITRVDNWIFLATSGGEGTEASVSDPANQAGTIDATRAFVRSIPS